MNYVVLGGSNSRHIAAPLAKALSLEYHPAEVKKFPDDESYIRITTDVKGKGVIYVNSLQPRPNESLVETILSIDAINSQGAAKVIAVVPYMAYARQDEMFNNGEAVSVYTVGSLFKTLKISSIITVDMHLHRIKNPEITFGSNLINLTAAHEIAKYLKSYFNYKGRVIVGPDEESEQWAKILADDLNLPYVILEKKRLSGSEVKIYEKELDVKGKDVIIIDDIISTGGTIMEAVKLLRNEGANKIAVTCTHPLLVGDTHQKLSELDLELLIGTDTVISPISRVQIYPVFIDYIKRSVSL